MTSAVNPLVSLRRHAQDAPWSIAELADLGNRLLAGAGLTADRETSARTIRFYVKRGVMLPPFGQGRGSAWGYPHLVELLAARLAKHHGEPLGDIVVRRENLPTDDLERYVASLLGVAVPSPIDHEEAVSSAGVVEFSVCKGVQLKVEGNHPLCSDDQRRAEVISHLVQYINSRIEES